MNEHAVLIIEDQREILARLKAAIDAAPGLCVVGTAETLDVGLNLLYELRPRLLMTDIGLPDGSGIEAVAAAAQADWEIDSVVISIFGDESRVVAAIRAGASGYILKSGPMDNVAQDIQAVLDGGSPISPAIARHLLTFLNNGLPETPQPSEQTLTERETEILQAVARGYKRKEIAQKLDITPGTVGNHINNIYKKLGVGSNTQAILQATRMGLL